MPLDESPWTFDSVREVYANPWIAVTERVGTRPDGAPARYGIVHAKVAVGVVPLTEDGRVVLVGQWRVPLDRWSWEIPEGGVDDDEDPDGAIARELREEAGYVAARWERLGGPVHLSNSHSDETALLYLATDLTHVGAAPDGDEVLEVITPTVDEAIGMVDRGEITDAMSVIALLRFARLGGGPTPG
ncbi:NUDIX domain-containing protein [Euzebya sp.]|uniref:NUDIX domain-containing protein n=1 Tax=Euzebya sp. TaxID=1971409 RepID=UPI003517DD81